MQSGRTLNFDEVVFACHSDQALKMLAKPSPSEEYLLKAIPYQKNMAYVHTDESLLPANKRAWAAWNYSSNTPGDQSNDTASHVCVHYLINKLQPLPAHLQNQSIIVSLNPHPLPKEELVHSVIEYSHPLFNADAVTAQKQLPMIQGQLNTWYCGAWTGYGFHEDGLKSGELVAEDIIQSLSKKTMHQSPSSNQLQ
jgi:predicted NAD/FAD-binding protein